MCTERQAAHTACPNKWRRQQKLQLHRVHFANVLPPSGPIDPIPRLLERNENSAFAAAWRCPLKCVTDFGF